MRKGRRIEDNNGKIVLTRCEKKQNMITYEEETKKIKNILWMKNPIKIGHFNDESFSRLSNEIDIFVKLELR